jgi:hypothetical protein
MAAMGALFAVKWVAAIVSHLTSGTARTHVDLTVWPLDLIVALPATFWAGVWLWRRQPLGYVVAGLVLLKMTLLGFTLVLNTWLVTLWGRPADPMLPFYAIVGVGGLAFTALYLRCVRGGAPLAPNDTRGTVAGARRPAAPESPNQVQVASAALAAHR